MYEFLLDVDEVTENSFMKYKLEVANEVGTSEISIRLHEEGKIYIYR